MGDYNDACAEVAAQDKLGVGDLEGVEEEVDAAKGEVDGEKSAGEVVQGCPQCRPHQDVRHCGPIHREAEHAEDDAYGGGDQPQGVVHEGD